MPSISRNSWCAISWKEGYFLVGSTEKSCKRWPFQQQRECWHSDCGLEIPSPTKRKQGLLGQTADSKTCTEMKRAKAILKKKLKDLDYATPRPARVCERCPDTAQASPWNKTARERVCTAMELHSQQRQHHSEWTEGAFQQRCRAREPHGKRNCDL